MPLKWKTLNKLFVHKKVTQKNENANKLNIADGILTVLEFQYLVYGSIKLLYSCKMNKYFLSVL